MTDDLLKRAVAAAVAELLPEISAKVAECVGRELAGTQTYHRKRKITDTQILDRLNGSGNVVEVARALGVSRRTVYRAIERQRAARHQEPNQ